MENLELELEKNRQTEIVEPYKLPDGWKWCRLGDVCKFENGYAFKSDKFAEHGTPVIRITNIKDNEVSLDDCAYTTETSIDERFLVKKGDLLIAMSGATTGKNGIYCNDDKAYLNQRVGNIKVIDTNVLCDKYRNYYIQSKEQEILLSAYGGAQPNISSNKISAMAFPLPPTLAEQQRIVNRIETMFAKLDQAQEKAQTVLDSFETRKAAILHKAFTGELTAKWRKENGVADDSWEEKKIGALCTVVRGGSPRPAGDPKYYDGSIPFMKVADITGNDSKYVYSTEYTIKEAGLHKTRMVNPDTLLLTNSGATLGVPAITKIKTTFNDGIAAFLNLLEESNLYFYYFWTSKTIELRTINMGAAQPNLNIDIISNIIAPVPTLPEQQEIVRILDTVLEKENRAKEAAQTVLDEIALLKKSILARAFRGEL